MKCSNDMVDLVMLNRQSVEIDYCDECRGVWLNRIERDRIIEKSRAAKSPADVACSLRRKLGGQPPYYWDGNGDESGV